MQQFRSLDRNLPKQLLAFLQRLFRSLALGDIHINTSPTNYFARFISNGVSINVTVLYEPSFALNLHSPV